MQKIYGYKEKDVLGLLEFIKTREGGTLKEKFTEYASISGKAQGTVRNLYYALAKKSNSDKEFCQKYLGGKPLAVSKIVEFDEKEERELIKTILKEKLSGKSVRSVIYSLSNGDEKMALRYQNKFRNFLKNCPELVKEYTLELSGKGEKEKKESENIINGAQIKRLKSEINALIEKISLSVKKENEKLRVKCAFLERENNKLKKELSEKTFPLGALNYFTTKDGTRIYN